MSHQTAYDNLSDGSFVTKADDNIRDLAEDIALKIMRNYEDDSTQVLNILSEYLTRMALGQLDSSATDDFHAMLDEVITGADDTPFSDFVASAIRAEAYSLAELNL